ncbi:MAG: hypothetical protein AAB654_13085 [Acidobacteriota bacterium]
MNNPPKSVHQADCDCRGCRRWREAVYGRPESSREVFRREWEQLPEETRRRINAQVEDYADEEDFYERYFRRLGVQDEPLADVLQRVISDALRELLAEAPGMRHRAFARERVQHFLAVAKGTLERAFGLGETHRPVKNAERDRRWSQLNYSGKTYGDIANAHQEAHPEEAEKGLGAEEVTRAVNRHRKRREALAWLIRETILRSGPWPAKPE